MVVGVKIMSEEIGDWFPNMVAHDIKNLRSLHPKFRSLDDETLNEIYSDFCKNTLGCVWSRTTKQNTDKFLKYYHLIS